MPVLGGRIKVGFDEFDKKNLRAYILFQHHLRNHVNLVTTNKDGINTEYVELLFIHFDIS